MANTRCGKLCGSASWLTPNCLTSLLFELLAARLPFQEGLSVKYRCGDFGHRGGKHAFDASREQRLYRLKPSCNGGSVPAKPLTALLYAERNFFIHEIFIDAGAFDSRKRRPSPRIVNLFLCRLLNDLFNSRQMQIEAQNAIERWIYCVA